MIPPLRHLIRTLILLALSAWLGGCAQPGWTPQRIAAESFPVEAGGSVLLQVNTGEVVIRPAAASEIGISGRLAAPDRTLYNLSTSLDQVHLQVEYRRQFLTRSPDPAISLAIEIPDGISLRVETFDANVTLLDLQGNIAVDSVSGDILAENVGGVVSLRSGRGNIQALRTSGEVRVLGEHGLLTLEDPKGDLGASTIMGTIQYAGEPGPGDVVRLETDHGPVRLEISRSASFSLNAVTNSGNMACMLSGLASSSRSCRGAIGDRQGQITVRTVSGDITVQALP
jgi:hypothetical protein